MSDALPVAFGSYTLLEKIAVGGMAEVFRAKAQGAMGFEKTFVIKRILDTLARDEEFKQLFMAEARIAAALAHVNIVQVFELGENAGYLYIAMEHVHGMDLARLVAKARTSGEFPIALALFIIGEVLKALQFAHTSVDSEGQPQHVVHCDISPQNVLLSYAGEVKLTDFGISRAAFERGPQDVIRGKYAYMSPEQVDGRALDGRSDLFSLATVLYELLTGRRLFKARTRDETMARVRRAEVPSPRSFRAEISEDLEAFLLKALARHPESRFLDAAEMLDALTRIILHEGHRATNHDLSTFLRGVELSASASDTMGADPKNPVSLPRPARGPTPVAVVVMALEGSPPPRSIATPRISLAALGQEWSGLIAESGGEVWESGEGSALVCWMASTGFRETVARAVRAGISLQRLTAQVGYRLSVGITPGVVRIQPDSRRPAEGWELSGPFYLARWMMNLSAHRGRVLLTEVGREQIDEPTTLLGRIPIQTNKYINVYELG